MNSVRLLSLRMFIILGTVNANYAGATTSLVFDKLSDHPFHQEVTSRIENAYASLGYEVSYEAHPLKRSYLQAKKDKLSGLMIRVESDSDSLTNMHKVPVPIAKFKVMLVINDSLCAGCELSELNRVVSVSGYQALEKIIEAQNLTYNRFEVSYRKTLFTLFASKRVDGIIISDVFLSENEVARDDLRFIELGSDKLYHYVQDEYKHLVPHLSDAFSVLTANTNRH